MATIMVVDDSATSREFLKVVLADAGYRILEAADGASALRMVVAEPPDLVISDILMPRMDGFEFVRRLRQRHACALIPVIFLSGLYDQAEARELARSCGVDVILAKDSEPAPLLRAVALALVRPSEDFQGTGLSETIGDWFEEDHLRIVNDKLVETATALERRSRRLAALIETNLQLASEHDPHRLLAAFCQSARLLVAGKYAFVGTLDHPEATRFEEALSNGFPETLAAEIEQAVLEEDFLPRMLLPGIESGSSPIRRASASGDPRALGLPAAHPGAGSLLAAPIRSPVRLYGWVCVTGKTNRPEFSREDERLLAMLAAQVGRIYEVASLCAELVRKEQQIILFQELVEQSGQGIGITGPDGLRTYMNPAERATLGVPPDADIRQYPLLQFYAETDQERLVGEILPEVRTKGRWTGEMKMRSLDGQDIPTFHHKFLVRDPSGQEVGIAHISTDLTAHRRVESRLNLLNNVFEQSGEALTLTDAQHRFVAVNPTFTRLTGYTIDDLIDRVAADVMADGGATSAFYEEMYERVASEGYWQGETSTRRKDGTVFPKWQTLTAVRDQNGIVTHHLGAFADITERKAAEAEIRRLAYQDVLTGLPNRLNLQGRLEQALAAARRDGEVIAVLYLDLDRFKTINDSLGHAAGDALLVEVGRRLAGNVRESDIVARLGGDEFVVVLIGMKSAEAVARQAEKLLSVMTAPHPYAGHDLTTTPSIGIAMFPDDGGTVEDLMKNADVAMYHAKNEGRNNYQFFTASLNQAAAERMTLEQNMRKGLVRDEFILHYQPQLDVKTGRTIGFEALVRWMHPEQGMISPGRFIPVAEETGMIRELGEWVLREALRELRRWRDDGIAGIRMAINVSAQQLRSNEFPRLVEDALSKAGMESHDIELEVTESAAMQHPEETIKILNQLREMGIELSIDDFGTGYSSLNYLKMLPVQRLKLDQSFVRGIETDPNDRAICTATIALAHSLGLEVVAEGVETDPQFSRLCQLGSDLVQGYLFSRPVPVEQARALIGLRVPAGGAVVN